MRNHRIFDQLTKSLDKISAQVDTCNNLFENLTKTIDVANEEYRQYSLTSPYVSFSVFNNDVDIRSIEVKLMIAQNVFVSLVSQCLGYIDVLIASHIDKDEAIDPYILQCLERLSNMIRPSTTTYAGLSAISFVVAHIECKVLCENSFKYIVLRNKLANLRINLQ